LLDTTNACASKFTRKVYWIMYGGFVLALVVFGVGFLRMGLFWGLVFAGAGAAGMLYTCQRWIQLHEGIGHVRFLMAGDPQLEKTRRFLEDLFGGKPDFSAPGTYEGLAVGLILHVPVCILAARLSELVVPASFRPDIFAFLLYLGIPITVAVGYMAGFIIGSKRVMVRMDRELATGSPQQ